MTPIRRVRSIIRELYIRRYLRPRNPADIEQRNAIVAIAIVLALWAWSSNEQYKEEVEQERVRLEQRVKWLEAWADPLWKAMSAHQNGEIGGFYLPDGRMWEVSAKPL